MEQNSRPVGRIFNTVHGSFVDGYGIRTTVFLKGCPLRCRWCCNVEGQKFKNELKVFVSHCNGCGRCVDACPEGVIRLEDGLVTVDRWYCTDCGDCVKKCYFDALSMFAVDRTVDDVFEEVRRDKAYYDASGGGLTIGGGEATTYPEFCLELIRLCHEEGIHVAVDTCGYVSDPKGLEVLKQADLLLYDIKGLGEKRHIENTGVSNRIILENLKMLNERKQHIIIRVPVIPGYNDDELESIAVFLSALSSVERVDLIAFHEFGKTKYEELGRPYTMRSHAIEPAEQQKMKKLFESYGLNTQLGG